MAIDSKHNANGGVMMEPYIVKEIKDRYGMTIESKNPNVLSKAVCSGVADNN